MALIKSSNTPSAMRAFSMTDIENHAKGILLKAQQQAESLLAAAQQQARLIKEEAMGQGLLEGRKAGMEQGRQEGYQAGHAAALNEHRAALTSLIQAMTAAAKELDASRRKLHAEAVTDVAELALAVARRVTKRQSVLDPKVLGANLNEAMKLVVHASDVRIAIHPSQKKTLEEELPKLQLAWPNLEHVELIEDATMQPGGCRLFTSDGHIDGDLEGQLDRIVEELMPGKSTTGVSPVS